MTTRNALLLVTPRGILARARCEPLGLYACKLIYTEFRDISVFDRIMLHAIDHRLAPLFLYTTATLDVFLERALLTSLKVNVQSRPGVVPYHAANMSST